MKTFTICALCAGLAPFALGQGRSGAGGGGQQPSTDNAQKPSFLAGRQLNLLCVHHHESGDAGSTILYNAKELDADKMSGRINVRRLTAIVVRFTHVNTFCYDYEAGVTKQVSFYASNMPSPLKPFFVGGLAPVFIAAGAAETFFKDQSDFKNHYDAYGPLGELTIEVRKAFADAIDPKKDNAQIREAVRTNLRHVFGYSDRDVSHEDLTLRQGELEAGVALMVKDIAKMRADTTPGDPTAFQTQMALIAKNEEALSLLSGQLNNYSTAIANLDQVKNAPDEIERVILLDPKYDEYEVTAAVALLKPKPTESDVSVSPAISSSTIVIDITGGGGLDFSTGVVATHPVTHDYFLKVAGATKTVMDGGARDPGFVPAAFVSYYTRPAPGHFAFGPTFGVDLSSAQNFYFGIAVVRGGAQRLTLVGGLSLSRLTVLNGDTVGQPPINGNSIQTKTRYKGGYFIGLTFNLGG